MRFKAMLQCNPFHSYMFNNQGSLLCASAAAIQSGICRTAGSHCRYAAGRCATCFQTVSVAHLSATSLHSMLCMNVGPRCDELTLGSLFAPAMYKGKYSMSFQSAHGMYACFANVNAKLLSRS